MHLLVACATPSELRTIKQKIQTYKIPHCQVSFLCTGIGMYETIYNLTKYIEQHKENKVDFLLNIGICGYITKKSLCDKGSNEKEKLEVPKAVQVATTRNIHTDKERIIPPYFLYAPMSPFLCSEKPILTKNHIQKYKEVIKFFLSFDQIVYVDMESRAIDYLCDIYKIPRFLLKVPYDHIITTSQQNKFNIAEALEKLLHATDYKNLLETILGWRNKTTTGG